MSKLIVGALTFLVVSVAMHAGEGEKKFFSGPQPGENLPGPFDSYIINGDYKGRQHCLVCENRLFPMVLVFIREPEAPKVFDPDGPAAYLLKELNKALELHRDSYLKGAGIFLSPHAQSAATRKKEVLDAKALVDEAEKRNALVARLTKRVEELDLEKPGEEEKRKDFVILSAFPDQGPEGYKIAPDAEVTIIFFHRLKVVASVAYPEGKMTNEEVDRFLKEMTATIRGWKAKGAAPKKSG